MTAIPRVLTAAEMQARDLARRRVALALLVALPVAFYLSMLGSPDEPWTLVGGGIGMGWSVAGAALFSMLASRNVDRRLVLAGYRPHELLLGRLLLLEAFALVLLAAFTALIELVSRPPAPGSLVVGLALAAIVGVPLGLAVAAVLPRELEGTLVIIGVVGINMSVPPDAALAAVLPFDGPIRYLHEAAGDGEAGAFALLHGLGYTLALLAVAVAFWARRVRVRRPEAAAA